MGRRHVKKKGDGLHKTKHSTRGQRLSRRMQRRVYAPCVECGGEPVPLRGADFMPENKREQRELFFVCVCGAWTRSNSEGYPIGRPCDDATRAARCRAHVAFAALIDRGVFQPAKALVKWYAEQLGLDPLAARIVYLNEEQADRVTRLMVDKLHETLRANQKADAVASFEAAAREGSNEAFGQAPPAFLRETASGACR